MITLQRTPAVTPPPSTAPPGVIGRLTSGPSEIYQAMRAQRSELQRQLERLDDTRGSLSDRLHQATEAVDRKGLEQRVVDVDARIADVEKQIAAADAEVARAAAIPGAVVEPRPIRREGPPEEFFVLSGVFMFVVLFPLTIAYARRIWRRGAAVVSALPAELMNRFTRLEQAVDAIAVEVERIGEGQRFVARYLAGEENQRALGAGAAEPIEVKQREAVQQRR